MEYADDGDLFKVVKDHIVQNKKIEDLKLFKKGLNKYIFRNNCCNYQLKELLIE